MSRLEKLELVDHFDEKSCSQLLAFGNCHKGQIPVYQLPFEAEMCQRVGLIRLAYKLKVKQISCGRDHTHILSSQGQVYSMGSNEHG